MQQRSSAYTQYRLQRFAHDAVNQGCVCTLYRWQTYQLLTLIPDVVFGVTRWARPALVRSYSASRLGRSQRLTHDRCWNRTYDLGLGRRVRTHRDPGHQRAESSGFLLSRQYKGQNAWVIRPSSRERRGCELNSRVFCSIQSATCPPFLTRARAHR